VSAAAAARPPLDLVKEARAALGTPAAVDLLPAIEAALKAAPADHRLWQMLGLIERQANRRERAIPALRRAAGLAPSDASVAHGLARTLFEAGVECIDEYGLALQLAPGDPQVIAGLTSALVAAGRSAEAVAGLEQIVARSPAWVAGHKLLADLRWLGGERAGFTRSFDVALGERPGDIELRRGQLLSLVHAEQFDEALAAIAAGRAAMGDLPLCTANEAVCRSELGDVAGAADLFERLTGIDDPALEVRRIRHLLRAGRPDAAAALVEHGCAGADAAFFWPYAATVWRLTGDPRGHWLEGDEQLVGAFDIGASLPPLDEVAARLRALHTARGQPLEQSVRGGTQTDGNLFWHIDPTIVALREAVRDAIGDYLAQLPPRDAGHPLLGPRRDAIDFAGAWSVRLTASGFHANHVHPQGWISSALYIALPPAGQADRQAGWLKLGEPDARLGINLAPTRLIEPRPGRLVLFPSAMWHGTRPFADGERLTIAFDVARPA
jgi:Flp pilus assembly protein TadD